uniref:Uncharacterized protein n=1 Tax=Arion vulgaris TaxID=1028688 RepID=A0A0B7AP23_9EUPU
MSAASIGGPLYFSCILNSDLMSITPVWSQKSKNLLRDSSSLFASSIKRAKEKPLALDRTYIKMTS